MQVLLKASLFIFLSLIPSFMSIRFLKLNDALERPCLTSFQKVDVDFKWMDSVEEFYFPWQHKLAAYRFASDFLNLPIPNVLSGIFNKTTCTRFSTSGKAVGFGGNRVEYNTTENQNSSTFTFFNPLHPNVQANLHFLYTDNKTMLVAYGCTHDGQVSWAVWSTTPTLSSDNESKAREVLTNAGFDVDKYGVKMDCEKETLNI